MGELLEKLYATYPGFKEELEKGFMILVNGKNIEHLQGLQTPLEENDVVSIFPPLPEGLKWKRSTPSPSGTVRSS